MRYLITGGAGRLGVEVAKNLTRHDNEVRILDLPSVYWGFVEEINKVESFPGDVTDVESLSDAIKGIDSVIHLAAILPPNTETNMELTMRVNVEGTRNIINLLKSRPKIPFVFASSISVYGITANEKPPIREEHSLVAHNYYSKSKIDAEQIVKNSGMPFVVLRIAPIAVAELIELPDIIPYRSDQRVEFIYVEDAAEALSRASWDTNALGKVINIAGGKDWQMTGREYIRDFYDALGVEVEPIFSSGYTAVDWYNTSSSKFLDYQRLSFNGFKGKVRSIAEELGFI
jgi:nucleoside-diphosphate-sugar epimerase